MSKKPKSIIVEADEIAIDGVINIPHTIPNVPVSAAGLTPFYSPYYSSDHNEIVELRLEVQKLKDMLVEHILLTKHDGED